MADNVIKYWREKHILRMTGQSPKIGSMLLLPKEKKKTCILPVRAVRGLSAKGGLTQPPLGWLSLSVRNTYTQGLDVGEHM